jgi:hypothetical protein
VVKRIKNLYYLIHPPLSNPTYITRIFLSTPEIDFEFILALYTNMFILTLTLKFKPGPLNSTWICYSFTKSSLYDYDLWTYFGSDSQFDKFEFDLLNTKILIWFNFPNST